MPISSETPYVPTIAATEIRSKRVDWIDFARGWSIIFVVIFHASVMLEGARPNLRWWWLANDFFAPMRMPVFFALSAMLGSKLLSANWRLLFEKRTLLLWYLYAVWSAISLFISKAIDFRTELQNYIISVVWPNYYLWFIWALGLFFVIAKSVPTALRLPVLIIGIVAAVATSGGWLVIHYDPYLKTIQYFPLFLAGAWYGKSIEHVQNHRVVVFTIFSTIFITLFFLMRQRFLGPEFQIVLSIVGAATGCSGSMWLCRFSNFSRPFRYIGSHTLTIYLSHTLFLAALVGFLTRYGSSYNLLAGNFAVPFLVISSICLAFAAKIVAKKCGFYWLYALPNWMQKRSAPR